MQPTQDSISKTYRTTCPTCGVPRTLACRPRGVVCKPCANRANGALVSDMERPGVKDRLRNLCREADSGCWEWIGTKKSNGYGCVWNEGRTLLAHRVSYEAFVRPIPDGLQIDHLCRNKGCINPAHLEPVTPKVNTCRARDARRDDLVALLTGQKV